MQKCAYRNFGWSRPMKPGAENPFNRILITFVDAERQVYKEALIFFN